MIGVLFFRELTRAARGQWIHYARWAYAGWLVVVLYFSHLAYLSTSVSGSSGGMAGGATTRFAHELVDFLVLQQTGVLLLAGPSFAAGAVTDEKVRGTLEPLFLAHLTPLMIILGKLLARVAQGFLWSLTAWPVIAFAGFPGGVTPAYFVALAFVTMLMLTGVSAVSLLASVWCRTTRDAAIIMYFLVAVVLYLVWTAGTAGPKWDWLAAFNPNYVLDVARDAPDYDELGRRLRLTTLVWGIVTVISTAIAAWRLRPAFIKQQSRKRSKVLTAIRFRPPIGEQPIVWKEQYGTRMPRWIGITIAATLSAAMMISLLVSSQSIWMVSEIAAHYHMTLLVLMSLAAGVRASGTITTERDQHTWDCLVGTPYDFRHIVGDKVKGICLSIWPYYFAVLIPALAVLSLANIEQIIAALPPMKQMQTKSIPTLIAGYGPNLAALLFGPVLIFAGLVGLAMLLRRGFRFPWYPVCAGAMAMGAGASAGWLVVFVPVGILVAGINMRFMAGVGAWMSARSRNGWLSLLGTVVVGYLAWIVIFAASCPLNCITAAIGSMVYWGLQGVAGIDTGGLVNSLGPLIYLLGSLLGLWWASQLFMQFAVQYLERTDRVPGNYFRKFEMGDETE